MDFLISVAQAQAGAAPAQPAPSMMTSVLMMVFIVGLFYFMMLRPQMKRAKEHRAMLSQLKPGDEVIVAGGLLGRVTELGDAVATIEIADGVAIKVQRHAITTVLPKGTLKSA
jgi:preprotein translocase subunit YajC